MMKRNATYRKGWLAGVALLLTVTLTAPAAQALPASAAADTVAQASTDTSAVLTDLAPTPVAGKPAQDTLWAQANAAYSNGQFRLAVQLYLVVEPVQSFVDLIALPDKFPALLTEQIKSCGNCRISFHTELHILSECFYRHPRASHTQSERYP